MQENPAVDHHAWISLPWHSCTCFCRVWEHTEDRQAESKLCQAGVQSCQTATILTAAQKIGNYLLPKREQWFLDGNLMLLSGKHSHDCRKRPRMALWSPEKSKYTRAHTQTHVSRLVNTVTACWCKAAVGVSSTFACCCWGSVMGFIANSTLLHTGMEFTSW